LQLQIANVIPYFYRPYVIFVAPTHITPLYVYRLGVAMVLSFLIVPVEFLLFLSKTYGTGNIAFDLGMTSFVFLAISSSLLVLQMVARGREAAVHEGELLAEVSELLNEMNIQIHELNTSLHQEFTRCASELGHLREELKKMDPETIRAERRYVPVVKRESHRLTDLFQ
jgi:hypothetical protein